MRLAVAVGIVSSGDGCAERDPFGRSNPKRLGFHGMLGASPAAKQLFAQLAAAGRSPHTVLIHGETGTGKELAARAIHEESSRAAEPFVIIDCGALPEPLLEAELFGHTRGAFTGAGQARSGALEAARGGTVFLDEVGELPLPVQPKLLRALEMRTVRRLGENHYRAVDVRFVSATHRDIRDMVRAGSFRQDLYFRLSVLPIRVPPLRERASDVPLLVESLLPAELREWMTPELLCVLAQRPWFGNVRELKNFLSCASALGVAEAFAMAAERAPESELPERASAPFELTFYEFRRRAWAELEREYLRRLLARHDHNVARAARECRLNRTYLHRLLLKHAL